MSARRRTTLLTRAVAAAGADSSLAPDAVVKAAPDGNPLLSSFASHTFNATLSPKLALDPVAEALPGCGSPH